jgi:hypothetical protein
MKVQGSGTPEGRSLLVLDTRSHDAGEALYRSLGYAVTGVVPDHLGDLGPVPAVRRAGEADLGAGDDARAVPRDQQPADAAEAALPDLAALLHACVLDGASIGFVLPFTLSEAREAPARR